MKKNRNYTLDINILDAIQQAALENARELLNEADLLYANCYYARAYFLAIASIEETGKAHIVFGSKNRNLQDEGLCTKIKQRIDDHAYKITAAFGPFLMASSNPKESVEIALNLMSLLPFGREKSMYIDIVNCGELSIPKEIVNEVNARSCIVLAKSCFHHTELYLNNNKPYFGTSYRDKFFCMKAETIVNLCNTNDFIAFYLNRLKQGKIDFEETVVIYHDNYYKKHKKYNSYQQVTT